MKFITKNLPIISLILIALLGVSLNATLKASRSCMGANNMNPECRFVNIKGKGGLCVSRPTPNANLLQANCANTPDQLWNVTPSSGGYIIQNQSGSVMDNYGAGGNNGNKVTGWTKNGGANQVWAIESLNNGNKIRIRNPQRNKCFDNSGTIRVGQFYHIWDCSNSNSNQWFEFTFPAGTGDNGFINIVTPTGLCVSDKTHKGGLVQEKCAHTNNMLWSFLPFAGGSLVVSKNGRLMDNSGNSSANGSKTIGYPRNNTGAQIWRIEQLINGNFLFKNVGVNKCFDDTGSPGIGKGFHQWDCSNTNKNQWFKLRKYVAPTPTPTPTPPPPTGYGSQRNLLFLHLCESVCLVYI